MAILNGPAQWSNPLDGGAVSRALSGFPGFDELTAALSRCGNGACYVAGGAIRNIALRRVINDVDVFLSRDLLANLLDDLRFSGAVEVGPLGSPRWRVTSDAYFDLVPIEAVSHGFSLSTNIFDVLNRFDITINAIAWNVATGEIVDPVGGISDVRIPIIRAVRFDYSEAKIAPNLPLPWRACFWLRIVHYASSLRLNIHPVTADWLRTNMDCIQYCEIFAHAFFEPNLRSWENVLDDCA